MKPFEHFGEMVFGEKEMKERLPQPVYLSWKQTVANEATLDRPTADAIAHAMKQFALEKGATHYTHWFQPLTGTTAEKHDAFLDFDEHGEPIARFSGKALIKGEGDASSFPSGGLRATFEARGYTYWDVTSPVFVRENTLCIPTVFVSYNGESLDKKNPLLKSIQALSKAATKVVNQLGDKEVKSCMPYLGLEQEYFLIDRKHFLERRDLKMCGRTLYGSAPSKGQELNDHYFGSIPPRVNAYMDDVNQQLWKLGIYAKTEHNEAAPGQFELAPIYSPCNIAIDQNQLIMDILKKTAEKHDLACLLAEKPFAKMNGSGKHNNWSILTDTNQNLFSPGEKPAENIRFLVFMCAFLKAVDDHALLLRMSASSSGNDHRLGAHEAPPAIISIYLGQYIEDILNGIEQNNNPKDAHITTEFSPISGLSYIPHDNADRNRTSPVAFTGNKFEFRMLGSSMSASETNVVLNATVAEALNEISAQLEGIKYLQDVREKALAICKNILQNHKRILFSGDGYSKEWVEEAKRRNLPNTPSFIESVYILDDPKTISLFESLGIYSEKELKARKSIYMEQFGKTIGVEVRTFIEIVLKEILPSMVQELNVVSSTIQASNNFAPNYLYEKAEFLKTSIDEIYSLNKELEDTFNNLLTTKDDETIGLGIQHDVYPIMQKMRLKIDAYDKIADPHIFHNPTYEDMLFFL